MRPRLDDTALDQIFRDARTHNAWREEPVPEAVLRELVALTLMAPTSANCAPMRLVFVSTADGKAKLAPHLMAGNMAKTMSAPVTAIIAHDMAFYEHLPRLLPHTDAAAWFRGNDTLIAETAFRNGSLQGAYLMLAARALGLDCGPMSGFDKAGVDGAFFAGTSYRSNFLCNLGVGDPAALHPRSPRFAFEDVAQLA